MFVLHPFSRLYCTLSVKWNNPVLLDCVIFAFELKKSAHNDTTFKKNAYLCPVS